MTSESVQELYDRIGASYDQWTLGLDLFALNSIRKKLLVNARGEVLEVAVGTGKNFAYYPHDCSIVGVDLSETMLREAERSAHRRGRRFTGKVVDARSMPYEDGRFDTVVCTLAACTFDDPVTVLRELRRVCNPRGRTLFLEHTRPSSALGARIAERATPLLASLVGCHPDRDALHNIRAAGFTTESIDRSLGGLAVSVVARNEPAHAAETAR